MSYEYKIEIETPAFVHPKIVAEKVREVIRRIIERYGVFYITTEVRVRTGEEQTPIEEESAVPEPLGEVGAEVGEERRRTGEVI